MYTIPRILHFIWAGGEGRMPRENIKNMLKWLHKNPNFEVYLWVDSKTTSKRYLDSYRQGIEEAANELEREGYASMRQLASPEKVKIKDIMASSEGEVGRDEYVRYEIEKPVANYGSSSDLLRYGILEMGGAYFDSDVLPGEVALDSPQSRIRFGENEGHVLYLEHDSQNVSQPMKKASGASEAGAGGAADEGGAAEASGVSEAAGASGASSDPTKVYIGNDAFICTAHNPWMRQIYRHAISTYQYFLPHEVEERKEELSVYQRTNCSAPYLLDSFEQFLFGTVNKTGPACLREAIWGVSEFDSIPLQASPKEVTRNELSSSEEQALKEARLDRIDPSLRTIVKNHASWLKGRHVQRVALWPQMPKEELVDATIKQFMECVKFEARHGFVRLDDYLSYTLAAFELSGYDNFLMDVDRDEVTRKFLEAAKCLDAEEYKTKIKAIQVTGVHPEVLKFSQAHFPQQYKLLFPNFDESIPWEDVSSLFRAATSFSTIRCYYSSEGLSDIDQNGYEISSFICKSLAFFELVDENIFKSNASHPSSRFKLFSTIRKPTDNNINTYRYLKMVKSEVDAFLEFFAPIKGKLAWYGFSGLSAANKGLSELLEFLEKFSNKLDAYLEVFKKKLPQEWLDQSDTKVVTCSV